MSVDFKIIPLQFVYNHTFNTIYILLHHLNMQNLEYNAKLSGSVLRSVAEQSRIRWSEWLGKFIES